MADEEEKKVLDLESLDEEVVPVEEEETDEEKEIREKEELEEEEQETDEEKEILEKKEDDEEEETDEEKEIREKEELEEEEETDEEKEQKEKEDGDEKSFDKIVSEKYAEKYDINSEEELEEILDDIEVVLKQSEALKAELDEAKNAAPKFKTKKEEKAFEFLQNYNIDKFGNGLGNLSRLIGMDVDKIDGKLALQEAYVLRNNELDREDALELFNEDFEKYSVNSEDFEEEADYVKKQKIKDIKRKQDVLNAKKFLSEQQEKLKVPDEDENLKEKTDSKVPEVSKESLSKYSKEVESSMKGFTSLIVSADEDGNDKFTYKLSKEQLNKVDLSLRAYIGNPSNYKDGEIQDFNPDETKVHISMALFGDKMLPEAIKYGISLGEGKRIEDIGKKSPKRKQNSNKPYGDISSDDQFEKLAEEKRKKREGTTQFA